MSNKLIIPILLILLLTTAFPVSAGPTSGNYELQSYGFGGGGTFDSSSSGYSMFGIIGEQSGDKATGTTYDAGPGLTFAIQADLPPAPSLTNPGSTYDRLRLVIDTGGNATDATYAVAISDDNWTTTRYVQSDYTVGDTLGAEDWLTYSGWGSASGIDITGLSSDTTYKVKVKAEHGSYTETAWSAEATAATVTPSIAFGISADTVTFDALTSGNSWTDSSKSTVLTTSTNAYNGYTIYGRETAALTDSYSNTIADYGSPNSAPTSWSGTGFGYTTNDANLTGGTADRFTNGGPNYAGFTASAPGDPVADHSGPIVDTPISNEQFTVSYRVTADQTTKAGDYTNTIIYVVLPEY